MINFGKTPPSDPDIESGVLSALLISRDALLWAASQIKPEHFYKEENILVARAIFELNALGMQVDVLTIANHLKKNGNLAVVGGAKYLAAVTSKVSTAAHIELHCRILIELYLKRELIQTGQKLAVSGYSDETDVFEEIYGIQSRLDGLVADTITKEDESLQSLLDKEMLRWQTPGNGMAGQPTYIPEVDRATGGLVNGELIVLAARPGQGKTAFALSIMRNLLRRDIPVMFFSLEMPNSQIVSRLLSQESGVWASKIRNKTFNPYDLKSMGNARARMYVWPMEICDIGGISLRELRARATRAKRKKGIKLLVVDYLQLMSGDKAMRKSGNRENEIAEISRGLKSLAKELDIPIIALSQLSRSVESRPDKMPILSDLRESGAIEQDADQVLFLMRPAYYKMDGDFEIRGKTYDASSLCVLDVAKYRGGDTGNSAVKFEASLMRFTSYEGSDSIPEIGFVPEAPEAAPTALNNPAKDRIGAFESNSPF